MRRLLFALLCAFCCHRAAAENNDIAFSVVIFHSPHTDAVTVQAYSCQPGTTFSYWQPWSTVPLPATNVYVNDDFYVRAINGADTDVVYIRLYADGNFFQTEVSANTYPFEDTNNQVYVIHPRSNTGFTSPYDGSLILETFVGNNTMSGNNPDVEWHDASGNLIGQGVSNMNNIAHGNYTVKLNNVPCAGQSVSIPCVVDPLLLSYSATPSCESSPTGTIHWTLTAGGQSSANGWDPIESETVDLNGIWGGGSEQVGDEDITGASIGADIHVETSAPPTIQLTNGFHDCNSSGAGYVRYVVDGDAGPFYVVWSGDLADPCGAAKDTTGPFNAGDTVTIYGCDEFICAYVYSSAGCESAPNSDGWIYHDGEEESVAGLMKPKEQELIQISPVPAGTQVNLDFPTTGMWEVNVFSAMGKAVDEFRTSNSTNKLTRTIDLPSGTYFIRAVNKATGQPASGRLIVLRG